MQTPFTVFLDRRNNGICRISSLKGTGSCFCPGEILRRNSCSGELNLGAAKAWLLKIKVSRFRWGQSSRHGSLDTSEIPNLFLAPLLAVKSNNSIRQKSYREKYERFLLSKVSFGMLEYNFNQPPRELVPLRVREQSDFDIAIANAQESTWPIASNAYQLHE